MAASGCATRHTGAQRPRRAAPCAERRARSARRRSGSPQAPGAQRPRHRRRARSARRRQLACWRSQHTLGGLCLLANSKKKGSPALALAHYFGAEAPSVPWLPPFGAFWEDSPHPAARERHAVPRGAQPNAWLPGCLGALVATGAPGQPCVALGYAAGRWHQHISCRRPDPARHRRDCCGHRSRGSWGRCGCCASSGPQLVRQVRADRARPCATNQPASHGSAGSSPSSPGLRPAAWLSSRLSSSSRGSTTCSRAWACKRPGARPSSASPSVRPRP